MDMTFFRFLQCYLRECNSGPPEAWYSPSVSAAIILLGLMSPILWPFASYLGAEHLTSSFVDQFPALMNYPVKFRYLPAIALQCVLVSPLAFVTYFSKAARAAQDEFNLKYSTYIGTRLIPYRGRAVLIVTAAVVGSALVFRASALAGALLVVLEFVVGTNLARSWLRGASTAPN